LIINSMARRSLAAPAASRATKPMKSSIANHASDLLRRLLSDVQLLGS
jgi:hypothetical protein